MQFHIPFLFKRIRPDLDLCDRLHRRSDRLCRNKIAGTDNPSGNKAFLTVYDHITVSIYLTVQDRFRIHIATGNNFRVFYKFTEDISTCLQHTFSHAVDPALYDDLSARIKFRILHDAFYHDITFCRNAEPAFYITTNCHTSAVLNISRGIVNICRHLIYIRHKHLATHQAGMSGHIRVKFSFVLRDRDIVSIRQLVPFYGMRSYLLTIDIKREPDLPVSAPRSSVPSPHDRWY